MKQSTRVYPGLRVDTAGVPAVGQGRRVLPRTAPAQGVGAGSVGADPMAYAS